jgi:hypothetical protein
VVSRKRTSARYVVVDVGSPVVVTALDGAIGDFSLIRGATPPIRSAKSHIATPDLHVQRMSSTGKAGVEL